MADTKISALANATALGGTEQIPGVQSAGNVNITPNQIKTFANVPAGSSLNIQYNNASAFAGMAGTSWDDTNRSLTLTGATVTTSNPVLNLTQTWNAGGVTFAGLKLNVTDTASATGSSLIDLQVGSASKFRVGKAGDIYLAGSTDVGILQSISGPSIYFGNATSPTNGFGLFGAVGFGISVRLDSTVALAWNSGSTSSGADVGIWRDAAQTLGQRNSTNAQEYRVYGSYASSTNYQRMSIKTLREASSTLSGATYTSTIAIPAYAHLIGVTTRVNTVITGATTYSVGDGTDVDLWGASIAVAANSQSRTADFTATGAVGAVGTARNVTLTANGSNFTGGVVEICLHYLTTESD